MPERPRRGHAALALLVLLAASAAITAAPQSPPARIVSLVPSVTEMLFAVGAGPQVVAVSSYDREPPEVERLPRVGALLDPDVERILSLKPDLVVVHASQADLRAQLARAGVRTFSYTLGGLADVAATMRTIGTATGHQDRAHDVASRLEARIAAVRARVAGRQRPSVLLVFGREPGTLRNLHVSGGVGFLHDIVEAAGGRNVFGDVRREAVQATTELVLARAPDVIIEIRPGSSSGAGAGAHDREAWARLASVPAVRNGRIHVLEGSDLVVPGPRVGQAAERISAAIHPDAWRTR